jgi:hypothetical protein
MSQKERDAFVKGCMANNAHGGMSKNAAIALAIEQYPDEPPAQSSVPGKPDPVERWWWCFEGDHIFKAHAFIEGGKPLPPCPQGHQATFQEVPWQIAEKLRAQSSAEGGLRTVLQKLVDAVGAMKVPQTLADAALQINVTLGPAYLAAKAALAAQPAVEKGSAIPVAHEPQSQLK